ncbi:MAG: NAD-dependent epimerase/dehydratase family protein [Proteobacteria bacterium]|nr:NAD-dependent epimerase/dehydratase family protein [Pseudomonadota bacterium]NCA28648.1 NAD-dependent epimerase/dehydratase family protein [Pseudomonadota bacterium]
MSKKILVTGGSGYFGETMVNKHLERGDFVHILDINKPNIQHSRLSFIQCDINDKSLASKIDLGFDIVHHNVAQVPIAKNKKIFWKVNKDGIENLLKACSEVGVKKIINTSSSAVYGVPKHNPVLETDLPRPMEDYGKAKYEAELICEKYIQKGLDISIVRPRTIMGHGRLGIFSILFEWIYSGANIPVLDGGKNIYQFVHANDLADACVLVALKPGANKFNIGAEEFGTMYDVLNNLILATNSKSKIKSIPLKLAEISMNLTSFLGISPLGPYHSLMFGRSMYFDISKAKNELGFSPKYTNDQMFLETYRWYVANRDAILKQGSSGSLHKKPVKQKILKIFSKIF